MSGGRPPRGGVSNIGGVAFFTAGHRWLISAWVLGDPGWLRSARLTSALTGPGGHCRAYAGVSVLLWR